MLRDLVRLESRPGHLTDVAYGWCSVIWENRESLEDWESLVLVCLEIGFRHLDFQCGSTEAWIHSSEHHRGLIDVVFKSQESEVIADLLHAWTVLGRSDPWASVLLGSCAGYLVGLQNLAPLSSRLRRLIIRSVEIIGYNGFEGVGVGVEGLTGLLNHLHVAVEDMDVKDKWAGLLLDTIQSPEGTQRLSHWYWETLVELAISEPRSLTLGRGQNLQITVSLTEAEEWSKLECWMGTAWIAWRPWDNEGMGRDLIHSTSLLFRQRPGAVQKLKQWMERCNRGNREDVLELFQEIYEQAHEATQQDTP
jgi:hypothetical protein